MGCRGRAFMSQPFTTADENGTCSADAPSAENARMTSVSSVPGG